MPFEEDTSTHLIGEPHELNLLELLKERRTEAERRTGNRVLVRIIQETGGTDPFGIHRLLTVKGFESHLVDGATLLPVLLDGATLLGVLLAWRKNEPRARAKLLAAEEAADAYRRRQVAERIAEIKIEFPDALDKTVYSGFGAPFLGVLTSVIILSMLLGYGPLDAIAFSLRCAIACLIVLVIVPPVIAIAMMHPEPGLRILGRLPKGRLQNGLLIIYGLFFPFFLLVIAYCVILFTTFILIYLVEAFHYALLSAMSNPIFVLPALFCGVMLYVIRTKYLVIYGAVELIVSAVTVWFVINSPAPDLLTKSLGMLGALYILVRGLDNISKGLPQAQREKLINIARERFRGRRHSARTPTRRR